MKKRNNPRKNYLFSGFSIFSQKWFWRAMLVLIGANGAILPTAAQQLPPPLIRGQEQTFPVPTLAPSLSSQQRYLVYIYGNSPLLLNAIRRTVPAATLQNYAGETIIQVGVFEDEASARQQIQALEEQGFIVQVDAIAGDALASLLQPVPFSAAATAPSNAVSVQPFPPALPSQFNSPSPLSRLNSASSNYIVYADDDRALNFARVQQSVPDAFRRNLSGQAIVQLGAFTDEFNAIQWARVLAAEGIRAKVGRLEGLNVAPVETGRFASTPSLTPAIESRLYYVIVPGRRDNLLQIANQVAQIVRSEVGIQQKDAPLGPHLSIGPFGDRQDAERWSRYLRGAGIGNARVYYGR